MRLPSRAPLAAGVAVPAQELGDLGLQRGLDEQAHPEAGDVLEDLAKLTLGGEQVVDLGADALGGRYSGSVTMTVPPGTSGTPLVGTVTGVPTTETFSLSGNVLTYSFKSTHLNPGTTVSITVTGMTNTRTTGAYTGQLSTNGTNTGGPSLPIDSGVTGAISFE